MKFVSRTVYFKGMLNYFLLIACLLTSCNIDKNNLDEIKGYKTENVIIVIVDGPRYSETWGDTTLKNIPNMAFKMRPEGVYFQNFYNLGVTFTNPGHTAIATGIKQEIENNGQELPQSPSILQLWLEKTKADTTKAWLITSKGKLSILANTQDPVYNNRYSPSLNCGTDGLGNGYREDSITFRVAKQILAKHEPNLVLINFKEPDHSGHRNAWHDYLKGIKASDQYVWQLWEFLQQDSHYKDKTTFIVTNDHGRHADNYKDGFISHGDGCESCRHISLLALGPDFKKGTIVSNVYEQVDIPTTIAEILGFKIPNSQGRVIKELFVTTKPGN